MALQLSIPLNEAELFILKDLFESNLSTEYLVHFKTLSLLEECDKKGFSREDSERALICLLDRELIDGHYTFGSSLPGQIRLSERGFEEICQIEMSDYDEKIEVVANYLNGRSAEQHITLKDMSSVLEIPFIVARHFVLFFSALGWVKLQREDSDQAYVNYISPLLTRALEEG